MKKIALILLMAIVPFVCFAKGGEEKDKSESIPIQRLLNDKAAFNKMVIQDISFAILGEKTPASGIEVDLSKAEIDLKVTFPSKTSYLFGLNVKAGGTDNNFKVFQAFRINTAYELSGVFHYIPSCSKAWFYKKDKPIAIAKNVIVDSDYIVKKDSFYFYALIYNYHFKNFEKLQDKTKGLDTFPKKVDSLGRIKLLAIVRNLTKNDSTKVSMESVDSILTLVDTVAGVDGQIDTTANNIFGKYNDAIVESYRKLKKNYTNKEDFDLLQEEKLDKKILNVKDYWTKKYNFWFSIYPTIGANKVNLYYEVSDSNYFHSDYYSYYGLNFTLNWMCTYPKKIIYYARLNFNGSHNSNLSSIQDFSYTTHSHLFSQGSNITNKEQSGIAYNANSFKRDYLGKISWEFYVLPLKSFIPGIYVISSAQFSKMYNLSEYVGRQNDFFLLNAELGAVFNINNKKDNNVLSLCPYIRFEDLTDKIRINTSTNIAEKLEVFYKRNLTLGFKVGIPIFISQAS